MLPTFYVHEYLQFERHQERQSEMAQQRLVARLRRHHSSLARRLAGKLGVLLVVLGTRLRRLELRGKQAVSNQGNVQETKSIRAFTTSSP